MTLLRLLPVAALCGLVACGPADDRCAQLDAGLQYCLRPTHTTNALDQRQKLVLSTDGAPYTLLVDLQVDAEAQQMVLLTPLGQTVAQLTFDNRTARRQGPPVPWPAQLSPAVLLGLVQLVWWPADQVQTGLNAGWAVNDSPGRRQILHVDSSRPWIDIRYDAVEGSRRHIHLSMPQRRVDLAIEVLESEGTSP